MAEEILGAGDGAGVETPVADEPVAQETKQQQETQAQPEKAQRPEQPVDLSQLPQFREFQRSYDQKIADMQRQLRDSQAKADEVAMAGMDDFERMEFQLEKERKEKEQLVSQYEMTLAEQYKQQGMAAIAKEHGVPLNVLDDRSPEAAEASALRYKLEQLQKAKGDEQAQETAERNRVDVGGGSTNGDSARIRARLKQARDSNDTRGYLSLVQEARERGVSI